VRDLPRRSPAALRPHPSHDSGVGSLMYGAHGPAPRAAHMLAAIRGERKEPLKPSPREGMTCPALLRRV